MKSANVITLANKIDLAFSVVPATMNDQLSIVHRAILEGVKLAITLKTGQAGNLADVLDASSDLLWNEDLHNEEYEAALTGLFLGALAVHDLEVEL